ncbi:MAG: 50S ribosomal protein L30 [Desulfurococcaceae archaeon TW002]
MSVLYAIIRLRGRSGVLPDVAETLRKLRLTRKYMVVIYPKNPSIDGMLAVVKDWVTWGEIDKETLKELLVRRGRLVGNKPITEEFIKEKYGMSIDDFVKALIDGELQLHKLDDVIKPVFRLHPPKGGFKKSTRKPIGSDGELGYRGTEINKLLQRMM